MIKIDESVLRLWCQRAEDEIAKAPCSIEQPVLPGGSIGVWEVEAKCAFHCIVIDLVNKGYLPGYPPRARGVLTSKDITQHMNGKPAAEWRARINQMLLQLIADVNKPL